MPTEIKEVNTTLTATIDVEWEIAIRKAYGPVPGTVVDVETVGNVQGPMTNALGGQA